MVGVILKFDNWSKNIFKILFNDIDISLWNFDIKYWESYGESTMTKDYNNLDHIDSEDAKKELIYNECEVYPEFLEFLAEDFKTFLSEVEEGDLKKEYLLPNIVDKLLKEGRANVKVLETQDRWFGVTYQEDKEAVQKAFAGLIKEGVYPANLWG